jgi:multidrug resistance protein, MATE family
MCLFDPVRSLNTNSMAFMVLLGLSAAISTRVSNVLATRVVVLLAVGVSEGLVALLVLGLRVQRRGGGGQVHREDGMMPLLAVSIVLDCQQGVLSGTVRTV